MGFQEIENQKEDYEKRLRRFRQDHERIKLGLEKQLNTSTTTDSAGANETAVESGLTAQSKKDSFEKWVKEMQDQIDDAF